MSKWFSFDTATFPEVHKKQVLLIEHKYRGDSEIRYDTGEFGTNSNGNLIGRVGNVFHFDIIILRYRLLGDVINE